MRVQLWSYNYDPEPTGIGPVSTVLAQGLQASGHEVSVVAAHPHYPSPQWGTRILPYREVRSEIPVTRLPLWIGRGTAMHRIRQEATFMAAQFAATPFLGHPDVLICASPSFPALAPAIVNVRARRLPWVLWLHDILPDGAAASGVIEGGPILRASRRLERAAYRTADRIVVLSHAFVDNLRGKTVPESKIELIYDPATRPAPFRAQNGEVGARPRVLSMGNIGHTQGLAELAAAFDRSPDMADLGARLVITGDGVAAPDVRAAISNGLVEMLGVVPDDRLEEELRRTSLALVSQSYEGAEFNLPSKIMNFMAYGLPVVAAVNPRSEVARLVQESGTGWVVDSSQPEEFPRLVARVLAAPEEMARSAAAGAAYAREHFTREAFIGRFDRLLDRIAGDGSRLTSPAGNHS